MANSDFLSKEKRERDGGEEGGRGVEGSAKYEIEQIKAKLA